MPSSIVTWSPDMSSLGRAAVAVGVFDGVHLGHQALLRDAVADAATHDICSIAVTFDRDPDQVVSPANAAPQLLTLADKLDFIADTGIEVVLVVPFTPELAEMTPVTFVESVLLAAMRPVTVHVGRDFRFGARAAGDVAELQRLGLTHDFAVSPHDLVEVDGAPVTSTRIRSLVAGGFVAEAAELLGHKALVTGTVHRGRGEGAKLGFPTANIVPVPFAALPADGVYAGRVILDDGVAWAAAISVGTPPMFPEARDYLEAHLIGFDDDIYDQSITLEFFERLRDQAAYDSLEGLEEAIADDVATALEIAGFEDDELDEDSDEDLDDDLLADDDLVEDPEALAAAEAAVATTEADNPFDQIEGEWAPLLSEIEIREGPDACSVAFMITSPLEAAGIPHAWEPSTPGEAPTGTRGRYYSVYTLHVPAAQLEEARQALRDADSTYVSELPPAPPRDEW